MQHDREPSELLDDEQEFEARRESLDSHAEGGHGGTEMGWLVSYADMMTLLVGLFVLLFSLQKQGSGTLESTMKKVSDVYFNPSSSSSQTASANPVVNSTTATGNPSPDKKSETPVAAAAASTPSPLATATPSSILPTDHSDTPTIATSQATDGSKPAPSATPSTMTADALKETKEELKKAQGREKAAKSKIKTLEDQLASAPHDASAAKVTALESEVTSKQAEIDELNSKLTNASNVNQRYMAVMISWETEKHDVDLYVSTPSNKTFNFKNREFKKEPGRFEIDSRFGPGIEMWKAEKFEPGVYKIRSQLYSKNGNAAPAKIKVSVVTNSETYKSESFELKDVGSQKDVSFKIDEKGHLKVLP